MADTQEELQSCSPCPWCGSEAAITDVRMSGYSFRPHCTRRGCLLWEQGVYFASAEEAAKVWNTRSAALPVEGEEPNVALAIVKFCESTTIPFGDKVQYVQQALWLLENPAAVAPQPEDKNESQS